jgi:hypothetical protein
LAYDLYKLAVMSARESVQGLAVDGDCGRELAWLGSPGWPDNRKRHQQSRPGRGEETSSFNPTHGNLQFFHHNDTTTPTNSGKKRNCPSSIFEAWHNYFSHIQNAKRLAGG